MAFRDEIQQFIEEVTGANHAGESTADRIHHAIREGIDVVGELLKISDDPTVRDDVTNQVETAAGIVVDRLMVSNPIARRVVKSSLPMVVPGIVTALSKYTGTADDFIAEHILPELKRCEETIHRVRIELGGV